eukprot:scaffold3356_cov112-Isochrysis_galbana.AAC.17
MSGSALSGCRLVQPSAALASSRVDGDRKPERVSHTWTGNRGERCARGQGALQSTLAGGARGMDRWRGFPGCTPAAPGPNRRATRRARPPSPPPVSSGRPAAPPCARHRPRRRPCPTCRRPGWSARAPSSQAQRSWPSGSSSGARWCPPSRARRAGRPRRPKQQSGLVPKRAQGGIIRDRHFAEGRWVVPGRLAQVRRPVPLLRGVKGDCPQLELVDVPPVVVSVLRGRDVALFDLEDRGGLGEGRAAPPRFNHARIARVGQRGPVAVKIGPNEHLVAGAEGCVALGRRGRLEAAVDALAAYQVELAHNLGVSTAGREEEQHAVPRASGTLVERVIPVPHPLLTLTPALVGVQGIQREHLFPLRRLAAERRQRGPAPDAALVLRVLPEVVVHARSLLASLPADPADVRYLILGVGDGQNLGVGVRLLRVANLGHHPGVLLAAPREGLRPFNLFQPEVGVGPFWQRFYAGRWMR